MAQKNVRFIAVKTVTKPATVKFKTRSGKTVSFKALRTVKMKVPVHFRAKRK
jgi:arginyl-tRNA synthetase